MEGYFPIRLFNHLGNGGSFTLDGNKTVSVSVTYVGSSGNVTFSKLSAMGDTYYSVSSTVTLGGFTIYKAYYNANYFTIAISPTPSSVSINGKACQNTGAIDNTSKQPIWQLSGGSAGTYAVVIK